MFFIHKTNFILTDVVAVTNPTSTYTIQQIDPNNLKSTPERTEILVAEGNGAVDWVQYKHAFPTHGASQMQVSRYVNTATITVVRSCSYLYNQLFC